MSNTLGVLENIPSYVNIWDSKYYFLFNSYSSGATCTRRFGSKYRLTRIWNTLGSEKIYSYFRIFLLFGLLHLNIVLKKKTVLYAGFFSGFLISESDCIYTQEPDRNGCMITHKYDHYCKVPGGLVSARSRLLNDEWQSGKWHPLVIDDGGP